MKRKVTKKIKQIGFFGMIFLFLTSIIPVALLLCWLSLYISPRFLWLAGSVSLAFPLWIILSILIGLIYLLFLKKRCLLFFLAVLLNYANIQNYIQFNQAENLVLSQKTNRENLFKILSYNVNLFDYYAQADNRNSGMRLEILDFIETENPDIICFQEYYENPAKAFSISQPLKTQVELNYHSVSAQKKGIRFGNIIFSRYPILQSGEIGELSKEVAVYADIIKEKDTLRVYSIHLASNKLDEDDHLFYKELTQGKEEGNFSEHTWKILKKIRSASVERVAQTKSILAHAKASPYPVIICGDLNEIPVSYVYHRISKYYTDCFVEKGNGLGDTYASLFPPYRIDYIFHSKPYQTTFFERSDLTCSDHFPIVALLKKN